MKYKEKLTKLFEKVLSEDIQLTLKGYGEWEPKYSGNELPKFYLKDKRLTLWIKQLPSGDYAVFKNRDMKRVFSTLKQAKQYLVQLMQKESPWNK